MAYTVLISYSWDDSAERTALVSHLEKVENVDVVYDSKNIGYSEPIHSSLSGLLSRCDAMIVLLTRSGIGSAEVKEEMIRAHERNKLIIPIVAQDVEKEKLPWFLRDTLAIVSSPRQFDDVVAKVVEVVREKSRSKSVPKPTEIPVSKEYISILKQMLVPNSLSTSHERFVVATNPLSYRTAFRARGGWEKKPLITYSDYVGIRGLMQSFGLIYGLEIFPELINPDDFKDNVLDKSMHLYTIGSPKANRWTGIMMKRFFVNKEPKWDFKPDPESEDLLNPQVIIRRDAVKYMPHRAPNTNSLKWDFGLVIRGPHPVDSSFMFMVLAGRRYLGTEATCLAVTDPQCLQALNRRLTFDGVDLDDHKQAFCAIVSIELSDLKTDKNTFEVLDVIKY